MRFRSCLDSCGKDGDGSPLSELLLSVPFVIQALSSAGRLLWMTDRGWEWMREKASWLMTWFLIGDSLKRTVSTGARLGEGDRSGARRRGGLD